MAFAGFLLFRTHQPFADVPESPGGIGGSRIRPWYSPLPGQAPRGLGLSGEFLPEVMKEAEDQELGVHVPRRQGPGFIHSVQGRWDR